MRALFKITFWSFVALPSAVAWAHLPVAVSPRTDDGLVHVDWTPVQIGLCSSYPFQLVSGEADVYGIAIGALTLCQQSAVCSLALVNQIQDNYFVSVGLIDVCVLNDAFEIGLLNFTGRNFGVSIGAFNVESNLGYRGNVDPYPWLPGLQVGLLNAGGGLQLGLLNYNPQGIVRCLPFVNFPWND